MTSITQQHLVSPDNTNTLIVVCCHAIYQGSGGAGSGDGSEHILDSGPDDEANWLIEPFQKGETSTFVEHIKVGLDLLQQRSSMLCFSGGATKANQTSKTEAEGYYDVARQKGWLYPQIDTGNDLQKQREAEPRLQVFQEKWATDSYHNILLSLIQYAIWSRHIQNHVDASSELRQPYLRNLNSQRTLQDDDAEITNDVSNRSDVAGSETQTTTEHSKRLSLSLPKQLIIVSHEFKRARFMELHLPTIQRLWSLREVRDEGEEKIEGHQGDMYNMAVKFVGINPSFDEKKLAEVEEGDRIRGYGAWKEDMRGTGCVLAGKRVKRGWDREKFLRYVNKKFDEESAKEVERMIDA